MDGEKRRPQQHSAFSLQEDVSQTATQEEITAEERGLIQRLKEGDEIAFNHLVEHYHPSLLCLARKYVKSLSSAEEVVVENRTAFRDPGHGTPELRHAPAKEGRSRLQSETRSARDRSLRSLRPCVTQAVLKAKNARTPEEGFFKES